MPRAWSIAAVAVLAAAAATAAQSPPIRVSTDLVHFGVTVTDKRGNVVPGLTLDDFEIVEGGQKQAISFFATGTDAPTPDLHVGVMFDTSESMVDDLEQARTAAIRFLRRLPQAVDLTLVEFDSEVRVSRFEQSSFPHLVERIRTNKAEGWTALYDAFAVYLAGTDEAEGRSVLVAFTDGGDSRSRTSYADLVASARASQATIYIVGLTEHMSATVRGELQLRMRRIAEETGGQALFPYSMKQIDAAYDRILDEIHTQYSLGYVSSNTRRDGRWREVRIRLKDPAHKDLKVRTRAGYFAPAERDAR